MRKLNAYREDAFAFYKKVVAAKRNTADDPTYKARLTGMEGILHPLFHNYDNRFSGNKLEMLMPHRLTGSQRADLLKLYAYTNSILQKLKIRLTTIDLNKVLNTCQCCTIGEVSSFDHLVPKDEFPEFAVNPKNLFPCCHKCNSYKNAAWRIGGVRTFLNLFLDDLPNQQYLFVDLDVDANGVVDVDFDVLNIHRIDANMFALLRSHYTNMRLFERFKQNSDSVIIPLVNSIKSARGLIGKPEIISQIKATSRANQAFFGSNYWKSVLELALADNVDFIDAIYDNP